MAAKVTPNLYATGRWRLESPFEVDQQTIYTCQAIRSLADIRARGIDPYETFYRPNNVSVERFEQDERDLANIVTLMSDVRPTVYVPDTYIVELPDQTVVPYRHIVLSVELGAVADTLVLDDFEDKISDLVTDSLGLSANIRIHQVNAMAESFTQAEHQAFENNRLANIQNNTTQRARIRALEAANAELNERNDILLEVLQRNNLLP